MSYNKTIWNPGDIITSNKWNKLINNSQNQIELARNLTPQLSSNNNDTIMNISPTVLKQLYENGVICYFIEPSSVYTNIYYLNKIAQNNNTQCYGFMFQTFNNDNRIFYGIATDTTITTNDSAWDGAAE